MTAKLDETLLDSTVTIHSLLCLAEGDYGSLLVGEEYCAATSGLLRTRAKARTQTLEE